jgi:ATP-binding cassette subfamily F protein uup
VAILVDLQNVRVDGADHDILTNLSLTISSGDRVGVVGINGAGKSTLLKVLAGRLAPDAGQLRRGREVRVGYLEQIPVLGEGTVRQILGTSWEIDATLERLDMAKVVNVPAGQLSGGQAKRVALAELFTHPYDLLILDEPTNHLDLEAIRWLEDQILRFRGAVVLVSHDRFLLDQVTTRMIEIDRGVTYVHAGGYAQLLEAQAEREERAASAEQTRRNLARTELAWLRRGVKARSTKPQARIDAAERLLAAAPTGGVRDDALELSFDTPRLGNTVVRAHRVTFSFDGERTVVRDVDLDLGPGDRVGVVGPNGAGKSTLLNLLERRLVPTSGTVKYGPTVVSSYFEQHDGDLDLDRSVQELVAGPRGAPGSPGDLALMRRFWFTGALPLTKARDLSGGERRRLQLLLVLASRPNVLFLDEPTNDLDLETIRLLEDFLRQWPGTLVVVSHDRTFLSRTTDRLIQVRRDGTLRDVPGGIDAWIAQANDDTGPRDGDDARGDRKPPTGRQLRDAEKEMTRLERRRVALHDKLLATNDHVTQLALGRELADVQVALERAEEIWLSLLEE